MGLLTSTIKHTLLGLFLYIVLIVVVVQEPIQTKLIYLNWVNLPTSTDLVNGTNFGFEPYEVYNFNLPSTDQVQLGIWQILPKQFYVSQVKPSLRKVGESKVDILADKFDTKFYQNQLINKDYDTVLYLHGNAGNRGSSIRFPTYHSVTDNLNCNLLVLDYRGFGDSTGSPSELGLFQDALITFDYLVDLGVDPKRISIMGHSLGTGVGIKLVHFLNSMNVEPKSLILTAPYTSIYEVMFDYKLFKFLPLLLPLKRIPNIDTYALPLLQHKFNSSQLITDLKTNILMFHGKLDSDISVQHSHNLFVKFEKKFTTEQQVQKEEDIIVDGKVHQKFLKVNNAKLNEGTDEVNGFRTVSFVELVEAGHNDIPTFKIFADTISKFWNRLN